jgi:hypothetical protein
MNYFYKFLEKFTIWYFLILVIVWHVSHVIYWFRDVKFDLSSERDAVDDTYRRYLSHQILSSSFERLKEDTSKRRCICGICIVCLLYGPRKKNRLSNMPTHALDKLFLRITYILVLFPMFYSKQCQENSFGLTLWVSIVNLIRWPSLLWEISVKPYF